MHTGESRALIADALRAWLTQGDNWVITSFARQDYCRPGTGLAGSSHSSGRKNMVVQLAWININFPKSLTLVARPLSLMIQMALWNRLCRNFLNHSGIVIPCLRPSVWGVPIWKARRVPSMSPFQDGVHTGSCRLSANKGRIESILRSYIRGTVL